MYANLHQSNGFNYKNNLYERCLESMNNPVPKETPLFSLTHQDDLENIRISWPNSHETNKSNTESSSRCAPQYLLQQLEEALVAEEDTEGAVDYEDRNIALSQSQASPGREDQAAAPNEDSNTDEGLEMQRKHLMDLLLSTRSKSFSGCFGGRLDRIGSSSSLGCNSMKG